MRKVDIYLASTALLLAGLYLKAPVVCLGAVVLWGINVAEVVLTKSSKDAEIEGLINRMTKLEKDHKGLSQDITNVSERAKTILGEVY